MHTYRLAFSQRYGAEWQARTYDMRAHSAADAIALFEFQFGGAGEAKLTAIDPLVDVDTTQTAEYRRCLDRIQVFTDTVVAMRGAVDELRTRVARLAAQLDNLHEWATRKDHAIGELQLRSPAIELNAIAELRRRVDEHANAIGLIQDVLVRLEVPPHA